MRRNSAPFFTATLFLLITCLPAGCRTTLPQRAEHPGGGTATLTPPGGLAPSEVPLFVQFGFDDNAISGRPGSGTTGGVRAVRELFDGRINPAGSGNEQTWDGSPARFSMYVVTRHLSEPGIDAPEHVKEEWRAVAAAGHEIGMHTHTHPHGEKHTTDQWLAELRACHQWLTAPYTSSGVSGLGIDARSIVGFRTPYLEHGPPLFPALRAIGLQYDCSIQEGFGPEFNAGNVYWPYRVAPGYGGEAPGGGELWEIPSYALVVPPDEECARYGVPPGLRDRMHAVRNYFDPKDGKITGFDWNLWVEFGMKPEEVVATFRYTLDQRLAGNRAPLTFGAHSDLYSEQYSVELPTTAAERREALREMLDYALAIPEARVVSAQQILDWVQSPIPLTPR